MDNRPTINRTRTNKTERREISNRPTTTITNELNNRPTVKPTKKPTDNGK